MIKVGLVSLGCAKNLIDSEIMIGCLTNAGMTMTPDAGDADVIVINTCSFIGDAKRESLQAIADMRKAAPKSRNQKLIVAGCLPQRFRGELAEMFPQVDAFLGLDEVKDIAGIVEKTLALPARTGKARPIAPEFVSKKSVYVPDFDTPRYRLTPKHSAYIKIAEGCNHMCAFCIIPKIRGRHRSRTIASIVKEAQKLLREGVKEINLISQDTTYFGMDRRVGERPNKRSVVDSSKGESLATLLRELNKLKGDFRIRLLYTHPAHWSDELIAAMADCKKVARYADIPLQHISDNILSAMKRETSGDYIRDLIRRMRAGIPGIAIRTTFIVGFPGETKKDFDELLEFIEETKFDRAGVFAYSQEEGTPAAKAPAQIGARTKTARRNRAMALLQKLSLERNRAMVGKTLRVLVDEPGVARSDADAMDIDGTVLVPKTLPAGTFCDVVVRGFRAYDLIAK